MKKIFFSMLIALAFVSCDQFALEDSGLRDTTIPDQVVPRMPKPISERIAVNPGLGFQPKSYYDLLGSVLTVIRQVSFEAIPFEIRLLNHFFQAVREQNGLTASRDWVRGASITIDQEFLDKVEALDPEQKVSRAYIGKVGDTLVLPDFIFSTGTNGYEFSLLVDSNNLLPDSTVQILWDSDGGRLKILAKVPEVYMAAGPFEARFIYEASLRACQVLVYHTGEGLPEDLKESLTEYNEYGQWNIIDCRLKSDPSSADNGVYLRISQCLGIWLIEGYADDLGGYFEGESSRQLVDAQGNTVSAESSSDGKDFTLDFGEKLPEDDLHVQKGRFTPGVLSDLEAIDRLNRIEVMTP